MNTQNRWSCILERPLGKACARRATLQVVSCLDRLILVCFLLLWAFQSADATDSIPTNSIPPANPSSSTQLKPDSTFSKIVTAIRSDSMPMTAVLYGVPEPMTGEFVLPDGPVKGMLQDTRTKVDDSKP